MASSQRTPSSAELKQRYGDEQVLVIPKSLAQGLPLGVSRVSCPSDLMAASSPLPRWQAEYNPEWRQLVSYIVLRQGDRLLVTERLRASGEARLHSLYALGVGGHINASDRDIEQGGKRELAEELTLDWEVVDLPLVGLINDLSNPVSQDHLGLLYLLDIPPGKQALVRETDKLAGQMLPLDVIGGKLFDRLESWSQLTIDWLRQARI